MKNDISFGKTAGLLAMLSGPLALFSITLIFVAFNRDFETAFNPQRAIAFQPDPSATLRWGWILDIFGYYLPVVPAILALHTRFSSGAPLHSQLFTLCGLGYVITGATGAAMLAGATVPLYQAFAAGADADKAIAAQVFANLNNEVLSGIWNLLTMSLAAVWFFGTGWLLRPTHRGLSWLTTVLGIASLVDVLGYAFQSQALAGLGLNFYLFIAPLWAIWIGWILWKER
ncbi:MAG: hypothetical protein L6Q97_26200 [Thermoanaerobaculia bacterium]|nr:hypothetical protein [Thermoanaerobaculia bacterium]